MLRCLYFVYVVIIMFYVVIFSLFYGIMLCLMYFGLCCDVCVALLCIVVLIVCVLYISWLYCGVCRVDMSVRFYVLCAPFVCRCVVCVSVVVAC